mmetsp:Transcript_6850/g.16505  ORF Transcript_6850/g.16505 Transcript_6850/m.16505 type:complete len:317 (+) Transcript_6850:375-1325(+)
MCLSTPLERERHPTSPSPGVRIGKRGHRISDATDTTAKKTYGDDRIKEKIRSKKKDHNRGPKPKQHKHKPTQPSVCESTFHRFRCRKVTHDSTASENSSVSSVQTPKDRSPPTATAAFEGKQKRTENTELTPEKKKEDKKDRKKKTKKNENDRNQREPDRSLPRSQGRMMVVFQTLFLRCFATRRKRRRRGLAHRRTKENNFHTRDDHGNLVENHNPDRRIRSVPSDEHEMFFQLHSKRGGSGHRGVDANVNVNAAVRGTDKNSHHGTTRPETTETERFLDDAEHPNTITFGHYPMSTPTVIVFSDLEQDEASVFL